MKIPTTVIGSFPHLEPEPLCQQLLQNLSLPAWPQLPRRSFKENMYVQYSARLPGIRLDEQDEKVYFDTSNDLAEELEAFYAPIVEEDVQAFALPEARAAGYYAMRELLARHKPAQVKGQVTGPLSLGLTVTDHNLRASLYDANLADAIVKNSAFCARWQVRDLKQVAPEVLLFVDEPYMASFGSAYIQISREQVIEMLDEVFLAIQQEGGRAGVHCCGNTDWPVLMATRVDVLNLDAVSHLESLALYPAELLAFLERGGQVAWGIVPNTEAALETAAATIQDELARGLNSIAERARNMDLPLTVNRLLEQSLLTPACGLGSSSEKVAERVLDLLSRLG